MMLDATQNHQNPLTIDRLFDWHAALFPTGRSGMYKIKVAQWRTDETGAMQVVSGGPHVNQFINKKQTALKHFLMNQDTAPGLYSRYQYNT